jgi:hypothetical protein
MTPKQKQKIAERKTKMDRRERQDANARSAEGKPPLYLLAIKARNILNLRDVDADLPASGAITVSGRNSAGKSSLISAIVIGLTGARSDIPQPIRAGENEGEILLWLGQPGQSRDTAEIKIVRRFTAGNGSGGKLDVFNGNGWRVQGPPQKFLDTLWHYASADLDFSRMSDREQLKMIAGLIPSDSTGLAEIMSLTEVIPGEGEHPLDALLRERQEAVDYRAEIKRERDRLVKVYQSIHLPKGAENVEAVDIHALVNQERAAREELQTLTRYHDILSRYESDITLYTTQIGEAQKKLEATEKAAEALAGRIAKMPSEAELSEELAKIDDALKTATNTNEIARKRYEKQAVEAEGKVVKEEIAGVDEKIVSLENAIAQMATLTGVDALSISPTGTVLYNGKPLSQAATNEKLQTRLRVNANVKTRLRLAILTSGNDLDETTFGKMDDLFRDRGYQLITELVDDENGRGIVMENGEIARNDYTGGHSNENPDAGVAESRGGEAQGV